MEIGANSAFNSGLQGFQAAQNRANEAAQNIASQSVADASTNGVNDGVNSRDIVTSLIELNSAENDARANANVIETASDVLGTLLDIEV